MKQVIIKWNPLYLIKIQANKNNWKWLDEDITYFPLDILMIKKSWNLNGPKAHLVTLKQGVLKRYLPSPSRHWNDVETTSTSIDVERKSCVYWAMITSMQKLKKLIDSFQFYCWSQKPSIWLDGRHHRPQPSKKF